MKRLTYDGSPLVTGTDVADALAEYAEAVGRMNVSATVDIPVLEDDGTVVQHSLLLSPSTHLETVELDHEPGESERFPKPTFPSIGGAAVAVDTDQISVISMPIPD